MCTQRILVRIITFLSAIFFGAGMLPRDATAQLFDGNALYGICRSEDTTRQGFCLGYLIGVTEGLRFGAFQVLKQIDESNTTEGINSSSDLLLRFCIPENASNAQLRDVVLAYLGDNPESRHETARFLVWLAYVKAFPCR